MLTIQFVPYSDIEQLTSVGRIRKLLKMAKEGKIVLLQGRLKKEEEKELIKATMEEINEEFKGIELAVIEPDQSGGTSIRKMLANVLLGDRQGFTIIGPASLVKEIKKDPNRVQLLMEEAKEGKKKKTEKNKRRY